jgi:hypothetical protein
VLFFGWLLVLASGIEGAQAIMVGHWAGFFHHLVAAVLFGVTGFLIVTRPVLSAEVANGLPCRARVGRRQTESSRSYWVCWF